MDINIGSVIQKLRKIKGLTQEQVADTIGVSKAAVSKWENGSTYPDITLLSPLARLFDTTVNELLEFNSTLTDKEINEISSICQQEFLKGDYFKAYEYCEKQLKIYPNVYELKLIIASLYWQYSILLKNDGEVNKALDKACELFKSAGESTNTDIKESAFHSLASLYMMQKDYDNALKTAEKLNQKSNDTMLLLAAIYRFKGEIDTSKKLYQKLLLKNLQTCVFVLQSFAKLAEHESNIDEAEFYLETVMNLDTLFEVQSNGEACTLPLAQLYSRNNKPDKAIYMLNRYVEFVKNIVNKNIDKIYSSKFFSELSFRPTSDGQSDFMKQHIADSIINTSDFDNLKDSLEFKDIIEKLQNL